MNKYNNIFYNRLRCFESQGPTISLLEDIEEWTYLRLETLGQWNNFRKNVRTNILQQFIRNKRIEIGMIITCYNYNRIMYGMIWEPGYINLSLWLWTYLHLVTLGHQISGKMLRKSYMLCLFLNCQTKVGIWITFIKTGWDVLRSNPGPMVNIIT